MAIECPAGVSANIAVLTAGVRLKTVQVPQGTAEGPTGRICALTLGCIRSPLTRAYKSVSPWFRAFAL